MKHKSIYKHIYKQIQLNEIVFRKNAPNNKAIKKSNRQWGCGGDFPLSEGVVCAGWAHTVCNIRWSLGILYVHITIFYTFYMFYVYGRFFSMREIFHNKFLFKMKQYSEVTLPTIESLRLFDLEQVI